MITFTLGAVVGAFIGAVGTAASALWWAQREFRRSYEGPGPQ